MRALVSRENHGQHGKVSSEIVNRPLVWMECPAALPTSVPWSKLDFMGAILLEDLNLDTFMRINHTDGEKGPRGRAEG